MTINEAKILVLDKKLLLTAKIQMLADQCNGGWAPVWGLGTEPKYYISGVVGDLTIHIRQRFAPAGTIFYKEKTCAECALEMFKDEYEFITGDTMSKLVNVQGEWYLRLTNFDVQTIANYQIKNYGSTSTLDIKRRLREYGFFATQEMVSKAMMDLGYGFNDNGTFRVYF